MVVTSDDSTRIEVSDDLQPRYPRSEFSPRRPRVYCDPSGPQTHVLTVGVRTPVTTVGPRPHLYFRPRHSIILRPDQTLDPTRTSDPDVPNRTTIHPDLRHSRLRPDFRLRGPRRSRLTHPDHTSPGLQTPVPSVGPRPLLDLGPQNRPSYSPGFWFRRSVHTSSPDTLDRTVVPFVSPSQMLMSDFITRNPNPRRFTTQNDRVRVTTLDSVSGNK